MQQRQHDYKVLNRIPDDELEERLNGWADDGYRLTHIFDVSTTVYRPDPRLVNRCLEPGRYFTIILERRTDAD